MHKKDRNIVLASQLHSVLDVTFGPSDDDFHYNQHHGTVSHEGVSVDPNQIDVKLIFQGGGCEAQYATGDAVNNEYLWNGYVNISPDGMLSAPFTRDDEEPFYYEFDSDGLRVYNFEGCPPDEDRERWLVFDSSKITAKE